jgi:hypothetical protein
MPISVERVGYKLTPAVVVCKKENLIIYDYIRVYEVDGRQIVQTLGYTSWDRKQGVNHPRKEIITKKRPFTLYVKSDQPFIKYNVKPLHLYQFKRFSDHVVNGYPYIEISKSGRSDTVWLCQDLDKRVAPLYKIDMKNAKYNKAVYEKNNIAIYEDDIVANGDIDTFGIRKLYYWKVTSGCPMVWIRWFDPERNESHTLVKSKNKIEFKSRIEGDMVLGAGSYHIVAKFVEDKGD